MSNRLSDKLKKNLINADIPEVDWIYVDDKDENCLTAPHQLIDSKILEEVYKEFSDEEIAEFFKGLSVYVFEGELPVIKDRYIRRLFEQQVEFLKHNNETYFKKTIKDRIRKRRERGSIKDVDDVQNKNDDEELENMLKSIKAPENIISACKSLRMTYKHSVNDIFTALAELRKERSYDDITSISIMTKVDEVKNRK